MKRLDYLALMDRVLDAYTPGQMQALLDTARAEGITEHGFPRLCANLGILIAGGFRTDLLPLFEEMMDVCCEGVCDPLAAAKKTGNEFSIVELVLCLFEVERAGLFPRERTECWRAALARLSPRTAYKYVAAVPPVRINNWAAFAAASEQARKRAGIADEEFFIRNQVASQLLSFDENGMYRDPHEPMLYDLMTRLQLLTALRLGYDGEDRDRLEALLDRAAELSLTLQSTTGEIPFGGRSAQYLYNEPCLAALFEDAAGRAHDAGDDEKARRFKAAAALAMENLRFWLGQDVLRHAKNRWPQTDRFGCEGYGYFEKYMVTAASNLYKCVLLCRDDLGTQADVAPDPAPAVGHTSAFFHKAIARAGEYFAEYDTAADPHYDASGLGRVHRRGAPSALCLTVPFTKKPKYSLGETEENPSPLTLCPVLPGEDGAPVFTCAPGWTWTLTDERSDGSTARLAFAVTAPGAPTVLERCTVSADGVVLEAGVEGNADAEIARAVPAFAFDGRSHTEIVLSDDKKTLSVALGASRCVYQTDGEFAPTETTYLNRSGASLLFLARGRGSIRVKITLE